MAGVLGGVALQTDSETKICIQEVDRGGLSGTRPGREEVKQDVAKGQVK